ncbi:fatty acid synthase-like [Planococcus citri]|uniref:fatty acid synthase-like n=1 Tax=Planococcus citri TaxID=170843 RepID=UPI0031F9BB99
MATQNRKIHHPDDIVISGISGVFPNSENFEEFKENLLAGKSMIIPVERYGRTMHIGAVKTLDRFDHTFFHITHQEAGCMTIGARIMLEKTFEAILDAGYNPQQIKGKKIAVLAGVWDGSHEGDPAYDLRIENYKEGISRTQFMFANRISNFLDSTGPSCTVNTACSSSMYALDMAIKYIKNDQCDGAIVCSSNFNFSTEEFMNSLALVNNTGLSAPFDESAGGYIKSEAVVSIFLQKRKDARRIYANVIHTTTNCDGFKMEGFSFPSVVQQKHLYEQFYKQINIDPKSISYLEAHGTGTQVGDVVEGTSIEEFFCKDRETPLKFGTVKSNTGHCEAAAALCGIAKLIVSFETGTIPPNINFKNPNPNIKGLHNGKLQIVTESTPIEGEYFGLNSFGIGGANGHLLLTPHNKIKIANKPSDDAIPKIVTVSGRTEEAVDCIFNDIEKNHQDEEYVALLHEIFSDDISGHLHRGFIICHEDKPHTKSKTFFSGDKRPVWFIFSGMGSQWPAMGRSLMKLPIFAESIRKSHQIMLERGIDLIKIITDDNSEMFDNILNSFVGITAIQIALFDMLKSVGIFPDGIIGHSVGELGCAYADGCLTAEQTILAAYYRGLVSIDVQLIHGSMAAVGAGYKTMTDLIPDEIEISCHNSSKNCTISGPTSKMDEFIEQLEAKDIFVRKVNTSNIPYHSRYIAPLGPKLMSHLNNIILEPELRSEKWICTSAPEHEWHTDAVKYSSAEYYTNNLLNPVFFEEGCHHIPSNAITVEIAPHGILNAILKHSLPETATNISLTMKNHEDGIEFLFNSLGKLYEAGCVFKLSELYPAVEFPVSKSTPTISSLIKWQHDEQWSVGRLTQQDTIAERNFVIQPDDSSYEYIRDHVIDGRNLYPGLGYLWLVLDTVAIAQKTTATKIPIVFENVRFERATNVPRKGGLKFHVAIHVGSKIFEVTENGATVATGIVRALKNVDKEMVDLEPIDYTISNTDDEYLSTSDIYKEMRLRGYQYKGMFRNIARANFDGTYAEISWRENFVTFMDSMAQLQILNLDTRELLVPTFVRKIVIDFEKHFQILESLDKENPKFPVHFYPNYGLMSSGAIQMSGWRGTAIPRQKNLAEPLLEKYHFVPYINDEEIELNLAIHLCVLIALENTMEFQVKSYEMLDSDYNSDYSIMSPMIWDALCNIPMVQANVNILKSSDLEAEIEVPDEITISNENLPKDENCTLIVLSNIKNKIDMLENIQDALKNNGFIIAKEPTVEDMADYKNLGFNVCFSRKINDSEKILLLNKLTKNEPIYKAVEVKRDSYTWISDVQNELKTIETAINQQLVLYAENDSTNGILGFFNCIRREENGKQLRCVYMMDDEAANFSLENSFYTSQLDKNLSHNVYKNGTWGCYRHSKVELSENVETSYALCALKERGNLSSFEWVEAPSTYLRNENLDRNLAHVYYSSLNFRDIMMSIGRISALDTPFYNRILESNQGFEFSGKDKNGTRIMGLVNYAAIATMVQTLPTTTWKVPAHMTLEDAATIPVVYATIIFAFFFKINLRPGSSVLIHAGSGGIGQAAINLCLYYKCTIFTTVGTPEKVDFIRKTFPQIPESHIGNSRDASFETLIKKQTDGRGVDVVLNSLSDDKLQASVRCLATHGHFLEIGRYDMIKNNPLELGHFVNNISFHSIQLDVIMKTSPKLTCELRDKLQKMLDKKIIKPIQRTIFQADEVESAFRHMASGKHTGKILIKIRDEDDQDYVKPIPIKMKAKPRVVCQKSDSYIIIGGLGGLGMELADWLIVRGARNIVLSSRTGIKNGYQSYRIKLWRSYDVRVIIFTEDVTQEIGVRNLFQKANSLGPVKGIFNLAVVLKDDPFSEQTEEHFRIANEPKAFITRHLDSLSRRMCPELKYFVVFSSVVCGLGNPKQTNYGYANAEMERICERRHADNLPALAVQWGAVGDAGIVAEMVEQNVSNITIAGTLQQKLKSTLETLDLFMQQTSSPIVASIVIAEKRRHDSDIINAVANILGIKDLKTINQSWTLPELGMDSILGIEIKQILESEFNVIFSPEDLRNLTFVKLHQMKQDKENNSKSGVKPQSQLEIAMDEVLLNKSIHRIPFDENGIEKPITFDENPTMFVFPGIEGLAIGMESLAKNLPGQVLCFQYHFGEVVNYSIEQTLDYFAKYILENCNNKDGEFHLIGYSMGGLFALGVVEILEKYGKKGHLYIIECSPAFWGQQTMKLSNEQTENQACLFLLQYFLPTMDTKEYVESIEKMKDWQSKKNLCLSLLSPKSSNEKTMNQLFDSFYHKNKALHEYEVSLASLESPCVLIRCLENPLDSDEAYSLSKYFKNPIQIQKIDADHVSILQHSKTAEIIKQFSSSSREN